jgi:non-specific serine/threonine protein kinase
MGVVYLGRDTRLNRPVAIKVLPGEWTSGERLQRFEREARTAAQLSQPNIATIYELGQADDTYFIAMEYIEGRSLRERLSQPERVSLNEALDLGAQIADALAAAHARNIVHRDLKPQNVMLTAENRVKILDFGLAKTLASSDGASVVTQLTAERRVLGTPGYMSPEQVRGEQVDARSDIFSFGVLLYEMVTGEAPFTGESDADILSAILRDTPLPVRNRNRKVSSDLDRFIARCLEKDREARFQTAGELVAELRRVRQTVGQGQKEETPSVAVLPFANMSADPDNEYFTDGMAEEIINALSKVEALRVVSRTSSFAFKGKHEDITKIGEQLRVRTVLEGSVRKAGKRLRITAQLINVADGYQLWSERYDRDVEDVFAIQDEIAQNITSALKVVLTEKEKKAIEKAPTENVKAYDYYLRGRQYFAQFRRKGNEFGRQMFKRAIEIDPTFALAYAGVADASSMLYMYWDPTEQNLREAEQAARTALDLDPELAEAHVAMGSTISLKGDFTQAQSHFEKAIQLDPQLFNAYYLYGRACLSNGRLEKAAEMLAKASELRLEDYYAPLLLATVYAGLEREGDRDATYRKALEVIEKHLELNPDDARAVCLCANAWSRLKDTAKAMEWVKRAIAMEPEEAVVLYNVACVYALLGEDDKSIDWLERTIESGFLYRGWAENDPDLDSLRAHPRFKALLGKM